MCRPDSTSHKKRVDLAELMEDMARVRYTFGTDYLQRLIDGVKVVNYYKGADDKTPHQSAADDRNPILLEDEQNTEEILREKLRAVPRDEVEIISRFLD